MTALIDLTGKRFGRLMVTGPTGEYKGPQLVWAWRCDCGSEGKSQGRHLRNGNAKSCGCLRSDRAAALGLSMKGRDVTPTPKYDTMHGRLVSRRGPARLHPCVDCGVQACDWSYDGEDPDEVTERRGRYLLRFSRKLEHYQPRCKKCHAAVDRWSDRRWGNVA